jgi:glucokinase
MTLLADIGGTHVRLGIAKDGVLLHPEKLKANEFPGFAEAVSHYLNSHNIEAKNILAATAAWPNEQGIYEFSNQTGWNFDPAAMNEAGYNMVRIFNDFEAASYGALSSFVDKKTLRKGRHSRDYPVLVCGPGTGLGLAYALPEKNGGWRVQPTFGARMAASCHTEEQHEVAMVAKNIRGGDKVLEFEELASGRGMILLHQAVCKMHGVDMPCDHAQQILEAADTDIVKNYTLRLFHEFLGLFIHTAGLITHSYGGVYLNGGMLDRLMERNLLDFPTIEKFMLVDTVSYISHVIDDTPVFYASDPFLALKGLMEYKSYGG